MREANEVELFLARIFTVLLYRRRINAQATFFNFSVALLWVKSVSVCACLTLDGKVSPIEKIRKCVLTVPSYSTTSLSKQKLELLII